MNSPAPALTRRHFLHPPALTATATSKHLRNRVNFIGSDGWSFATRSRNAEANNDDLVQPPLCETENRWFSRKPRKPCDYSFIT